MAAVQDMNSILHAEETKMEIKLLHKWKSITTGTFTVKLGGCTVTVDTTKQNTATELEKRMEFVGHYDGRNDVGWCDWWLPDTYLMACAYLSTCH